MCKLSLCLLATMLWCSTLHAQQYTTRSGYIGFFSTTPLEDIKAENRQVYVIIDTDKKQLAFTCLVKGFLFKKELMQQHFNENYIESDKYPKATFSGSYSGDVTNSKNGTYNVQVPGDITLHGVTKKITTPAVFQVNGTTLSGEATFTLSPADFNITIPALVKDKIAKQIDVRVQVACNPK